MCLGRAQDLGVVGFCIPVNPGKTYKLGSMSKDISLVAKAYGLGSKELERKFSIWSFDEETKVSKLVGQIGNIQTMTLMLLHVDNLHRVHGSTHQSYLLLLIDDGCVSLELAMDSVWRKDDNKELT